MIVVWCMEKILSEVVGEDRIGGGESEMKEIWSPRWSSATLGQPRKQLRER